jgi:hypothetical protein
MVEWLVVQSAVVMVGQMERKLADHSAYEMVCELVIDLGSAMECYLVVVLDCHLGDNVAVL